MLKPATVRTGGWDVRNLFADWPRRLILIGCMFGFWAMLMDRWTEEALSGGSLEAHGFWIFAQFGKELAGESAFAAGKWVVPSLGLAWCLYCSGIGPRSAPPWALTWPLMIVIVVVLWEVVDYFDTGEQLRAAWAQHPDVAITPPGGMLRFAMTQALTGVGAWLLYRSQGGKHVQSPD